VEAGSGTQQMTPRETAIKAVEARLLMIEDLISLHGERVSPDIRATYGVWKVEAIESLDWLNSLK
jgi:hypothetical protein